MISSRLSFTTLALTVILVLSACKIEIGGPPPDATAAATSTPTGPTEPPSSTPPPTPTIIPSSTNTGTNTPTEGPTPTATLRPLAENDPRRGLNLTRPDYIDDFERRFTWGEPITGSIHTWVDGRHQAVDPGRDGFVTWSTADVYAGNFYVEISVEVEICSGKDAYGIAVRVGGENMNTAFVLEFSCDGHYRLRRFFAGAIEVVVDWTPTDDILMGSNQTNRMGLYAQGTTLAIVANEELQEVVEYSGVYEGNFGIFPNAAETVDLTVYFDEFWLWYIDP